MTRFIGYGWNVTRVSDANDLDMLARAYQIFWIQRTGQRSSLSTATLAMDLLISMTAARRMVSRWVRRRYGLQRSSTDGRKMPSSWCQKA